MAAALPLSAEEPAFFLTLFFAAAANPRRPRDLCEKRFRETETPDQAGELREKLWGRTAERAEICCRPCRDRCWKTRWDNMSVTGLVAAEPERACFPTI